jgi:uncharacterized protein YaaN involved in tellurite resistance
MEENNSALSAKDKLQIEEIAKNLDLSSTQSSVQFASAVQSSLSKLSDRILRRMDSNASIQESAELIDELLKIINETSSFEEPKGFLGKILGRQEKYNKRFEDADLAIDSLAAEMDIMRINLLKENVILEEMYRENLRQLRMLEIYIAAGEKALEDAKKALSETEKTNDIIKDSSITNLETGIRSFEKRLYDLRLSRTIALQTAPQIALMQENNRLICERLETIMSHTIPLWRKQIAIAAGLEKQNAALNKSKLIGRQSIDETAKLSKEIKQAAQKLADAKKQGDEQAEIMEKANEKLKRTIAKAQKIGQYSAQNRLDAEKEFSKISAQMSELNGPIRKSAHRDLLKPKDEG